MTKTLLSLLAGMFFVAGAAAVGSLTRPVLEMRWVLICQTVWAALFIAVYRRHGEALNAWLSLTGIVLGAAGATLWSIGAEALLSVTDFVKFMLGYGLYLGAIGPAIAVALFLIFRGLRQRSLRRHALPNPFCKGSSS